MIVTPATDDCRPRQRHNTEVTLMKTIILAAALSLMTSGAFAATCKEDTAAKKLAGAAATSHMKKCQSDATAKCEADSRIDRNSGSLRL